MILKYPALSLFGTVSAITVSGSSTALPIILKAILVVWFLFIATAHLLRAFHDFELNLYRVSNIIIGAVYLGISGSVPRVIDRLSSVSKDLLIGIGAALLIFMFVERCVQSFATTVSEPLYQLENVAV
jgi:hypothetical protein